MRWTNQFFLWNVLEQGTQTNSIFHGFLLHFGEKTCTANIHPYSPSSTVYNLSSIVVIIRCMGLMVSLIWSKCHTNPRACHTTSCSVETHPVLFYSTNFILIISHKSNFDRYLQHRRGVIIFIVSMPFNNPKLLLIFYSNLIIRSVLVENLR